MTINFDKIRRNMEVRAKAMEAKRLIDEALADEKFSPEEIQQAWRLILNEVFGRDDADRKMAVSPMSYDEARRWYHNHVIEFGRYKDWKCDEVPFSYLERLAWQPDFRRDLTRFMASEFVRSQAVHRTYTDGGSDTQASGRAHEQD